MSYQKHNWVKNEIIRSKYLNNIENGISNEEQRASNAESGLSNRITTNANAIATLNGDSSTEGSVDYKIAQATYGVGGYKVVADHTLVADPSDKYIYLEPDDTVTGNDKFREWIYYYDESQSAYVWKMTGDVSLDLSGYVQKTDYASDSSFGVAKVDGTTIVSNNGVLSSGVQGGVTSFNGRTGAVSPQSGDYSASDVGLGNVGNFKAVSTEASQGLSSLEQANARSNIGAGTSSFSGSYNDLSNKPTLGTASALDVASSGDASLSEVVKGDDSRLTDSRTPTSHTHTKNQITDFPTLGTAAALDVATSGNAGTTEVVKGDDTRLTDSRTPTAHTHTTSDISNFPSLGTAAALDVASSGDASSSQVVKGNDSRLSDSRTPTAHTHTSSDITDFPSLATVATSGSYNDLSNKPTIPANTSDLNNDSGFITSSAVPTKTSDLTNDSGFIDYKAVSTVANQGLSDTEKANARANIGAGASSFSGDYNDLTNKPTLGTASALDVASSGDASSSEVVKGDDSRLTDSRTPTSHTHTTSDISNFPTLGTASSLNVASSGDASTSEVVKGDDSRLTDARTPTSHTHTMSDISNFPTLGTAATKDVPVSGNASTTQVVMGDDTRLTDSRTPTAHTHTTSDISNFPSLATVATSGSYNDLSNTPTIPGGFKIGTTVAGAVDSTLYFIRS